MPLGVGSALGYLRNLTFQRYPTPTHFICNKCVSACSRPQRHLLAGISKCIYIIVAHEYDKSMDQVIRA